MQLRRILVGIAALVAALAPALPAGAAGGTNPSLATFEGRTIDLRKGWGEAAACSTDGTTTTCYRTEADMDAALGTPAPPPLGEVTILSDCSSSLRLYASINFTTPVLQLTARSIWLNLSSFGFDNRTSSYAVGACSSIFAENANGGGSWYPGSTSAGSSAASMVAGWNDRISSVFIN